MFASALVFFTGAIGLLSCLVMAWLASRTFGQDNSNSHGISVHISSRLGGLGILASLLLIYATGFVQQHLSGLHHGPMEGPPLFLWACIAISLIGLLDDLGVPIPPGRRLFLMLTAGCVLCTMFEHLLPASLVSGLVYLDNRFSLIVFSCMVWVGFINASNMADGANGLMATVALNLLVVSHFFIPSTFLAYLIVAVFVFLTVNVFTGRLFLGDFGAYFLGSLCVFQAFYLYQNELVSIGFLAVLLAYPSIESLRVVVNRVIARKNPMSSAEDHIHNALHQVLKTRIANSIVANSATGLLLSSVTVVGSSLLLFLGQQQSLWISFAVFAAQAVAYLSIFGLVNGYQSS